jgi:hypothetical protein
VEPETSDKPRTRIGLVFAVVVVAGCVGMWVYLFAFADPNVPDQLDDESYGEQAQEICEAAVAQVDDLPIAQDARSPEERGATVEQANTILTDMVAELRAIAPTDEHDAPLVQAWLSDWDAFLGDRADYAADLLAGNEDAELLVTARAEGGGQITVTIDHFAEINHMPDCATPLDA